MKNKICRNPVDAVADIQDGASIMMMSFVGPAGIAQNLILALRDRGVKNLTVYANNMGVVGGVRVRPGLKSFITPGILVENHQVKRAVVSVLSLKAYSSDQYASVLEKALRNGEDIQVDMVPAGVIAERIAAGGAGVGGFYSPVGVGTPYAEGKEKRVINGREYIFEPAIRARFGFVRAHKADKKGNLVYRGTGRCFNPLIAKACDITIAEVDEIVEVGKLSPEEIVTPGICVDRIVGIPEGGWK